jgi:hypothetical protein
MENKINIAELLKDCPKGMELDCAMFEDVFFDEITNNKIFPICIKRIDGHPVILTKYGGYANCPSSKCVIFPKGRTTWEGFIPPCKFKAGDVLYVDCADEESDGDLYKYIFILKEIDNLGNHFSYCHLYIDKLSPCSHYLFGNRYTPRLATEEEKAKLFKAIKDNGYKWNEESKTLEKLIEPKFKVGDRIVKKNSVCVPILITNVSDEFYYSNTVSSVGILSISEQDEYELVLNKFDINTLVPFESKVLVRNANNKVWRPTIFGCYMKDKYEPFYVLGGTGWKQCIPYEGNEHLLGKTDDCEDYYKAR